jgi:hypothetical protein
MKILVCGGREYLDGGAVNKYLTNLIESEYFLSPITAVIHGGAKGADSLAGEWAKANGITQEVFKPDWNRFGKAAGFIRNSEMLKDGKPDLVVAFPGGRGTAMMVDIARRAGVQVKIYSEQ